MVTTTTFTRILKRMKTLAASAVVLLLVGGLVATAQLSSAQPPAPATEKVVWEYKVIHLINLVGETRAIDAMVPALEKNLNEAGGNGWELCQEINGAVVFKRKR